MITYVGGRRVGQTMKKLIKRLSMQSGGGGGGGPGRREKGPFYPPSQPESAGGGAAGVGDGDKNRMM